MAESDDTAPDLDAVSERKGLRALVNTLLVETRSVMPAAGATGLSLVLVIAAMCFLASLALGAALSVAHVTAGWTSDLSGAITIEVKQSNEMSSDEQVRAILYILSDTKGVKSARALTKEDVTALLEPWLGAGNVTDDLPLPHLIDVRIDANAPPDLIALSDAISMAAPGAVLDTHRQWQAQLLHAARAAEFLAYAVLLVVTATTIAIITFATRAGLSANREVVEVLHLTGARDKFIAAEVQRHFLHLGFRGGLIGLVLSVATFLLLGLQSGGTAGEPSLFMLPVSGLRLGDYPALIGVPVAAALVAVLTARITVMRTLHRLL
ncbi:MAG: cell division protein [Parvibaculum sp.]|nr:cell division protein [Parvibaculum sp.]